MQPNRLSTVTFSTALYEIMQKINPGIAALELYEFDYALKNLVPSGGWQEIQPDSIEKLERQANDPDFFASIHLKTLSGDQLIIDPAITSLCCKLLVGLVTGTYPVEWVKRTFYFDIRSFVFFYRTPYFTSEIQKHFGGHPYLSLTPTQHIFDASEDIGYQAFSEANKAVDEHFVTLVNCLADKMKPPLTFTLVGPTAAGKSEITDKMRARLTETGHSVTSVEMDNFFKDREFRDGKPIDIEVIHYQLFIEAITRLQSGKSANIPRYDFIKATSSHDLDGTLRPGQTMIKIQPADIILLEGNFPFHIPEISPMIDVKTVYLTDDPVRLKRKWKRDVDYRKKYHPAYLTNRFFKTQYQRSGEIYRPMMAVCELVVDTSAACIWVTPEISALIAK